MTSTAADRDSLPLPAWPIGLRRTRSAVGMRRGRSAVGTRMTIARSLTGGLGVMAVAAAVVVGLSVPAVSPVDPAVLAQTVVAPVASTAGAAALPQTAIASAGTTADGLALGQTVVTPAASTTPRDAPGGQNGHRHGSGADGGRS